ncbi:MAG: anti-sigma regulatory factor [Thermodesulfobacteriota bacterium]
MQIEINTVEDIVTSRYLAKGMAGEIGFGILDQTKIATAISEITRNIIKYARDGVLSLEIIDDGNRKGLEIICTDKGPGIRNIELAMKEGYSTSNGLGMGLPGVKKLMDEFSIESETDQGTTIVVRKWLPY